MGSADSPAPVGRRKARRGPVDPRLLRYARAARTHLVVAVLLALVITASIVVMAVVLGRVLAGVITDPDLREFSAWTTELIVLAGAVAVRGAASWWQARLAHRAGATVVAELESAVLRAGAELPPRQLDARRTELAVVVGDGLSGLRGWFTGYLPALLLACLVPPIVLVVIAFHDPTSALIAVITVPLIPLFMVLIGLLTQGRAEATLAATTRLSDQLLDLFAGMPTLRALGREGPTGPTMVDQVRALGDSLRQRTMRALRIAFLSSMVLESLATLSVALIAVAIGLRLVYGEMTLYAGLVALILAPEVYWPLRQVGEKFHAAQDGMAAADKAFTVLEAEPVRPVIATTEAEGVPGRGRSAHPQGARILVRGLTVAARSGNAPEALTAAIAPGTVTVLTGPNGCGKSTTLQAILGLIEPDAGAVHVDCVDVRELDSAAWWARVAWLPQRPVLVPGTLRENVELLGAGTDGLDEVSTTTGFESVLAALPDRWDTRVGQGGVGLSLGERQRLALTRVLAARRPILLLDEPTAHLDSTTEQHVLRTLRTLAADGATVVIVGHRPTVLAAADVVVQVSGTSAPGTTAGPGADGAPEGGPESVGTPVSRPMAADREGGDALQSGRSAGLGQVASRGSQAAGIEAGPGGSAPVAAGHQRDDAASSGLEATRSVGGGSASGGVAPVGLGRTFDGGEFPAWQEAGSVGGGSASGVAAPVGVDRPLDAATGTEHQAASTDVEQAVRGDEVAGAGLEGEGVRAW